MLHPDNRDRAKDIPLGDHGRRLVERHPPYLGRLVHLGGANLLRPARQEQVLRVVGVADHRLASQHILHVPGAPAGFLLNLARRGSGRVFAVIDIAAWQSHTQRSTMNRCRSINSTRSPGSSSTTVIAQRRIRNTYWVKRTSLGSCTSAKLTRT